MADARRLFLIHSGMSADVKKLYDCSLCNDLFATRSKLLVHLESHAKKKHHECTVCQKAFRSKRDLLGHSRTHTKRQPYQCTSCPKLFSRKLNLDRHLRMHDQNEKNGRVSDRDRGNLLECDRKPLSVQRQNQCNRCLMFFSRKSNLDRHLTMHDQNEKNGRVSVVRKRPLFRQQSHTTKKNFKCNRCPMKFSRKWNLDRHLTMHDQNEKSGRVYVVRKPPSLHRQSHTTTKDYECNQCLMLFSRKWSLDRHLTTHDQNEKNGLVSLRNRENYYEYYDTKSRNWKCNWCPRTYTRRWNLTRHLLTHEHNKNNELVLVPKAENPSALVPKVENTSDLVPKDRDRGNLLECDRKPLSVQRQNQCNRCLMFFSRKSNLDRHLTMHDQNEKNGRVSVVRKRPLFRQQSHTTKKNFKCNRCPMKFSRKWNLDRHLTMHDQNEKNGRVYVVRKPPSLHRQSHTTTKDYECNQCLMLFSRKWSLDRHLTTHDQNEKNGLVSLRNRENYYEYYDTKSRNWKCNMCPRTYTRRWNLTRHLLTHEHNKNNELVLVPKAENPSALVPKVENTSDLVPKVENPSALVPKVENPFECTICHRSCKDKSSLCLHLRTHAGDTPYKCEPLQKMLNQISNLTKNLRIHTGETPYECGICRRSFRHNSRLKQHLTIHTGERPYPCTL